MLEKDLKRIAPGSKVLPDDTIKRPNFLRRMWNTLIGREIGTRLVSEITRTKVEIRVNHFGLTAMIPTRADGKWDYAASIAGGISSSARIYWDPAFTPNIISIRDGHFYASPASSALTLAHEMIHALNWTRFPGEAERFTTRGHTIFAEGRLWGEEVGINELRAVGFKFTRVGDITEHQISDELNEDRRVIYSAAGIAAVHDCAGSYADAKDLCR